MLSPRVWQSVNQTTLTRHQQNDTCQLHGVCQEELCCHLECHIYDNLRATGWNPQKHLFFQKTSFWLSSKSSQSLRLLGQLFCVFMWIIIEFFTKRSRSPSLQSFCGPFWELEKWSNCVKLGKIQKLLQKNSILFFCSIYFRFVFVFSFFLVIFLFLFPVLVGFFRFWIKFDKIQKLQKTSSFFRCFRFFSNYFRTEQTLSIDFQIIFESQKNNFQIISN